MADGYRVELDDLHGGGRRLIGLTVGGRRGTAGSTGSACSSTAFTPPDAQGVMRGSQSATRVDG